MSNPQTDDSRPVVAGTPTRGSRRRCNGRKLAVLAAVVAIVVILGRPLLAEFLMAQGRNALAERDHQWAFQLLSWSERIRGSHPETAFLLAQSCRRLEQYDAHREWLKTAHQRGWRASELEIEQLKAMAQLGQFDDVEDRWADLFVAANEDTPEISQAYVIWCLSRFQLPEALEVLELWHQEYPESPRPFFYRGQVLEVMLRWQEAASEYELALQRQPNDYATHLRLGKTLIHLLKTDVAKQHLSWCIEQNPGDSEAVNALVEALLKNGQINEARQELERLIGTTDDVSPESRALLGELELEAGNPERARETLELAATQRPESHEIRYLLVKALQRLGKSDAAQTHLDFVTEATRPMLNLGRLTSELVEDPTNVELRFQIGMITWKYKSRSEGAQWFRSLLSQAPDHAATHRALAEHYRLIGDDSRADMHDRAAGLPGARPDQPLSKTISDRATE